MSDHHSELDTDALLRNRRGEGNGALILERWWRELWIGQALPIRFIAFNAGGFDPNDFVRHEIERPASIAKAVPKRQAEFLAGRLAARDALLRLGSAPEPVGIGSARQPLWPAGVTGSISHSEGVAAALAVPAIGCAGVGLDVERIVGPDAFKALCTTVVGPAEMALLAQAPAALSLPTLLTICFSAKESFFKGTYAHVRRYFDFTDVRITAHDTVERWVEITVDVELTSALPPGRVFRLPFTFVQEDLILTAFAW